MLRDFDHFMAYRASPLFRQIAKGYEDKTKHKVITLTYYGQRMVTANKAINKPEDMKGMKLRVPPAPLFLMFTKSVGANATPIAFAEVYLALQQGTVDGQENPLPTIMAKKFYEVQSHIILTGHITESLLTIVGSHVWPKLYGCRQEGVRGSAERRRQTRPPSRSASRSRSWRMNSASSARPWSSPIARLSVPRRAAAQRRLPAAGRKAEYDALQALNRTLPSWPGLSRPSTSFIALNFSKTWMPGTRPA